MPTAYSVLLAVPGKKTSDADVRGVTLQLLRVAHRDALAPGEDDEQSVAAVNRLQALRDGIQASVGSSSGKSECGEPPAELRSKLAEYLRCLSSLVAHFPILEGEGSSIPCFTWHDAFHPSRCARRQSFALERASCLFNLGATICQQALTCDKSTPEGAQTASVLFQEAAGVFTALKEGEAAKVLAPQPEDLSPACLEVLSQLMLVQAQQVAYRKAVLERVSHRETARLAEQLSVLYSGLRQSFLDPALSRIFDKCMVAYTTFKASLYHAEALAQIGKALHSEGSVGKSIPVLKDASVHLLGTRELAKAVGEAMAASVAKIQDSVKKSLARSKRDNTIALQQVPSSIEVDITLLGSLVAQPIMPSNLGVVSGPDSFLAHLGPPSRPVQYFECMTTLVGHTGEVRGVAISADGDHIVTGSADGTVKIWGVPEELLATLHGHMDEVTCVAITPDCKSCLSGSRDKTVRIWDLETGHHKATLVGHSAVVSCLAISPDGQTCLVGSYDDNISIWDIATAQQKGTLVGHEWGLTSLSSWPDGKHCVSGSGDETIKIWDLTTGQLKCSTKGIEAYINCVAANPSEETCVSASWDESIRIWDMHTGELRASIRSDVRANFSVAITPSGTSCVTGSDDDHIRMWDLRTGQLKGVMDGHTNDVISLAISHDGTICVSGSDDGTVRVWDIAGPEQCVEAVEL